MSIKVLFVDYEFSVLQGIRRRLRFLRDEWNPAFAQSGQEALSFLEHERFDVIVTDMCMPGMDGATLLAQVMSRYPQVLRIVLSGHSDFEMIIQAAGVTHQYLSKPCSMETLKTIINRALALRQLLQDLSLRKCVSRMTALPSVPLLYGELLALFQLPNVPDLHVWQEVVQR